MSSASVDGSEKSPDKVDNIGATKPNLSPRDQEILMAAWLSIKGAEPQVDYDKLAKILSLKNAHSANTSFYNVKKKIKAFNSLTNGDSVTQSTYSRPKTATPRKRSAAKGPLTPKSGKASKRAKVEEETPAKEEQEGSI
ncbi:hypothetical protein Sste5346_009270 [Sporothrix stenoceras]|uniref:Uncharacterized protein n=1 Tax=Sporothrix stenoceras TaxID=5173 RepID=A0ABR3YKT2_9PEZI